MDCKASMVECPRGVRTYVSEDIQVTNSPLET
jgi:hypothetical protein